MELFHFYKIRWKFNFGFDINTRFLKKTVSKTKMRHFGSESTFPILDSCFEFLLSFYYILILIVFTNILLYIFLEIKFSFKLCLSFGLLSVSHHPFCKYVQSRLSACMFLVICCFHSVTDAKILYQFSPKGKFSFTLHWKELKYF